MCLHDSARGSWLAGHASQELYNTFVFSFLFFITTTTTPNFFRGIGRWLWPNAFSVAPYRPGCKESNLLFRFLFLFIWIFSFWIFFYWNVHLSVPITICSGNHIRVSGASTLFAMTHMHSPPGQVHKVGLRVIFFLYIHHTDFDSDTTVCRKQRWSNVPSPLICSAVLSRVNLVLPGFISF